MQLDLFNCSYIILFDKIIKPICVLSVFICLGFIELSQHNNKPKSAKYHQRNSHLKK